MKNLDSRGSQGGNSNGPGAPYGNKISILQKPVRASQNLPPKYGEKGMDQYAKDNHNSASMPLSPELNNADKLS